MLYRIVLLLFCLLPIPGHENDQSNTASMQAGPAITPTFAYDVVSIRQVKGEPDTGKIVDLPDGFSMRNLPLGPLITSAYGVFRDDEILGWPKWAASVRFDIEAKMDVETADALHKLPREQQVVQRQLMLQSLLADRFDLKVHRSSEVRTAYELVLAKGGLRMKENHQTTDMAGNKWQEGVRPSTDWSISYGKISGHAMPVSVLVDHLQGAVDSIIVNKTGLTGRYDVLLHWNPSDKQGSNSTEPSFFTALEEQLGLRLKPFKMEVGTIVIDHIEMPSPN